MNSTNGKIVFVGLSGGVDSSVAALRLIGEGYTVLGVFIKVWQPSFLECNWEQERLDAMRVAAKLNIPFLMCDAEQTYKDDVAEYFIEEYKNGRTPNPDVMCNKYVKFGAYLNFAIQHNADYIATGHYAQKKEVGGNYQLFRGVDQEKDQSYFLWTLTQEQLSKVLLPVGNSEKKIIRAEAEKAALITAAKKDSQGICFLGQVDIPEFLSHYITLEQGTVLNTKGEKIGTHQGALVYTAGQRHGFIITEENAHRKPYYVISRDTDKNTITVSTERIIQKIKSHITLTDLNYIHWVPEVGMSIEIQTRYRQKPSICKIIEIADDTLVLEYVENAEQVSPGQSCVLYDKMRCLGGGIIL